LDSGSKGILDALIHGFEGEYLLELFIDCILDAAIDSVKILPFLFLTYLLLEMLEQRLSNQTKETMRRSGKLGPIFGGLLGVVPQCGFSAAASNLYAGGVVTAGTLLAVFLSTSDEMLPIFISEAVDASVIAKVLASKVVIGIISGIVVDLLFARAFHFKEKELDIHDFCEHEHCHCEEGKSVFRSACMHTIRVTAYIFVISFVLNYAIESIGQEQIAGLVFNRPVVGELLAALIGLIPNCAASVVITQLYLSGVIGTGAMMAGLLTGSGVGLLVLLKVNHNSRENLRILLALYVLGVVWGLLFTILGVQF
jgi:hypothetical protein